MRGWYMVTTCAWLTNNRQGRGVGHAVMGRETGAGNACNHKRTMINHDNHLQEADAFVVWPLLDEFP